MTTKYVTVEIIIEVEYDDDIELDDEEIMDLAVAKNVTRCGIGGILLDSLIGRLTLGRPTLVFPVRKSNMVAQLWLKQYGLTCTEIDRGRYADGEDGYIFEIGYEDAREYLA